MPGTGPELGFEIGVSFTAFKTVGEAAAFEREYRGRRGSEPRFELSYELGAESLAGLRRLRGRTLSVHAPCPGGRYFPNLGSRDPAVRAESLEMIKRSAGTAADFAAEILVLHAGLCTDAAVHRDTARRLATLESDFAKDEWLWSAKGSICKPGYCSTARYLEHRDRAVEGLAEAMAICEAEGVSLAVENLNPRLSYLFQLPSEFVGLAAALPGIGFCVDIGHLWISSLVHGFDFSSGLREILATGRAVTAHVHDNASRPGSPPDCGDDHALVGSGRVPVRAAIRAFAEAGLRRIVIEVLSRPLENLDRVEAMAAEIG